VTIDQPLPVLSGLAALGAAWAAWARPGSGAERGLKAAAIGALALYAYLRGMAPGALGIALVLSAGAQLMPPRERNGWTTSNSLLHFGAWIAFAYLLLREGGGRAALADPAHAGPIALALLAAGLVLARLWRGIGEARMSAATDLGALLLMVGAAFTLRFDLWPAMAGAAAVFIAELVALWRSFRPEPRSRPLPTALWLLNYAGQAAIASVFVH
jgi:hypothetical protein